MAYYTHSVQLHESGKQVFAAVGSLHIVWPIGLLALVENCGYKVERIELQ